MVIPKIDTSKNKIFEIEPSSNNRIFYLMITLITTGKQK